MSMPSGGGPPMMHQQMNMNQQQQMGGPSPHPSQGPPPPGPMIPHAAQQPPGPQPHPGQPPHPGGPHHPHQQQVHPEQGRMDNISKAKSLVVPIKESLSNILRTGASAIYANNMVDSGSKPVEFDVTRFDRTLEEFFTLCDQMEVNLKTSIECINQGICSQRYLQTPVALSRVDGLTYPQYISVVKGQIAYAKEIHDTLAEAAQKLTE